MSELSPIGWDALSSASARAVSLLWIIAPAVLLCALAFALRYLTALRSLRRFDARGAGPWSEHRVRLPGRLHVVGAEHAQGLVIFAQYARLMHADEPERIAIDAELRVLLEDGRSLRIPAKTEVKFEVSAATAHVAGRRELQRHRQGNARVMAMGFGAVQGAPLWVIVPADFDARALSGETIEVHFARVDGRETRIGAAFALLCASVAVAALLVFADGLAPLFIALEALLALLALLALGRVARDRRALAAIEAPRRG